MTNHADRTVDNVKKNPARVALLLLGLALGLSLVALAVIWPGTASNARADAGPHVQGMGGATTDACAGCHRVHTAPAASLLLDTQPGMCYNCHGTSGQGAQTSVQNGSFYTTTDQRTDPATGIYNNPLTAGQDALRGGGFDSARIYTSDPSLANMTPPPVGTPRTDNKYLTSASVAIGVLNTAAASTSKHSVDGSAQTAWGQGSGATVYGLSNSLKCTACHDPHGNGQFRALRPIPIGSTASTGVSVTDETTKNYTTADYLRPFAGLDTTPPATNVATTISAWCAQCHTRYMSSNTGDATFNYRHKALEVGADPAKPNPTCLACHVSHGTNAISTGANSGAVKWPDPVAAVTAATNSRLLRMDNRGICEKCHNK